MAIRAVQICVGTALALVPRNVLIFRFCFSALKNGRGAKLPVVGEQHDGFLFLLVPDLDKAEEILLAWFCRALAGKENDLVPACVQTDQFVLEPEFFLSASLCYGGLALAEQLMENCLVQLPRSMLVSVGQREPFGSVRHSQMFQFPLTARQPAADLPERVSPAELAKHDGD